MTSRRILTLGLAAGTLVWLGCPADTPDEREVDDRAERPPVQRTELEEPDPPEEVRLAPAALEWEEGPMPGVERAVLSGDPDGTGPFVMRLRFPAGHRIDPHWHPSTEYLTVLSGAFRVALGVGAELEAAEVYPAGSFLAIPAETQITALAEEETVVQIHGAAPFETIPAERPVEEPAEQPAEQPAERP